MRKLLLIDDDQKLAEPLEQYFSRYDLLLDSETHPLRALERLRQQDYDLVVLDVGAHGSYLGGGGVRA